MFDWLADPQAWIGLLTLTVLEIVLGIDNIVFISILSGKLPAEQQNKARKVGLALALITRILLLLFLGSVMSWVVPLFRIGPPPEAHAAPMPGHGAGGHGDAGHVPDPWGFSGRDLILILGGLFLLWKAVHEIHQKLEGEEGHVSVRTAPTFSSVIVQILFLDIVFSLDSVITAVGMVNQIGVMITAVLIAVGVMLVFVNPISDFVNKHPTIKMLALAFLVLIGANILAEGFEQHIPKGYTYFAMAFSIAVEMLNLRVKSKTPPVHLHEGVIPDPPQGTGVVSPPETAKDQPL
jgi:predicted tellurium resistance membrane protein TerC